MGDMCNYYFRLGMCFWCSYLLILLQLLFLCVHAQNPNSDGFINIDCGLQSNTSYVNGFTGLTYVSDEQFIDTGVNGIIANEQYPVHNLTMYAYAENLRYFPNGTKNCYTLTPVTKGSKYIVRASFYYGNYDQSGILPRFDLYLGVNFWVTVNIGGAQYLYPYEIITVTPTNYIEVCLVNTRLGTPFISALEVRPLNSTLYQPANSTQSLFLEARQNMGSNDALVRYPNDPLDRLWTNYTDSSLNAISTSSSIDGFTYEEVPSLVLQTAVVSSTSSSSMDITSWTTSNVSQIYFVVLYFAEIQILQNTSLREFYVYADGKQKFNNPVSIQKYLKPAYSSYIDTGRTAYSVSLKSSTRATLPPILNAFEIFMILPMTALPTDNGDVTTINSIKKTYSIRKNWNGDPCVPTSFSWTGVNCTMNSSNIPRITVLNLSSSGLTGAIVSAFGDLTELETLDLSQNNLSGNIPNSLDQLTALKFLDISENSGLSKTLPPGLQKKQKDGQLTVLYELIK